MSTLRHWWIPLAVAACASGGGGGAGAAAPMLDANVAFVYRAEATLRYQNGRRAEDGEVAGGVGEVLVAAASPSGRRVAVAYRGRDGTRVVAVDAETGTVTDVRYGAAGTQYTMAWSTDGRRLGVGFRPAEGAGGVKVLDARGEVRDLRCRASNRFVAWRSAAEAVVSDGVNFYVVSSSDCATLASVSSVGRAALEYAPSGARLAYLQDRTVTFTNRPQPEIIPELWIAGHDGSGARVIADYQSRPRNAVWAPNGDRIAYEVVSRRWSNTTHLVIYDVPANSYSYEASEQQLGVPSDFNACWSPDSRRVAHERTYARVGQGMTYTTRHVVVRAGGGEKVVFEELIGEAPGEMRPAANAAPCRWMGPRHLLVSTRRGQRLIGVDDGTVRELPADRPVLAATVPGGAR